MPRQNAYTPQSGPLKGYLSVIVDVKPERFFLVLARGEHRSQQ